MNASARSFRACLVRPDFGAEPVEGEIRLTPRTLCFQSGRLVEEIPLNRAAVRVAEDGESVCFSDEARPDLEICTADDSILRDRSFVQCEALYSQLREAAGRRELKRRLLLTGGFFLGCVLVAWLGSIASGVMVRALANRVPQSWQDKAGAAQIAKLNGEGVLVNDTNAVAELKTLATPLLRVLPGGPAAFQFHIMRNEFPNAFALPGGHVVVTTALLKLTAGSPDELLGVVAHEVAHVTQKHAIRKLVAAAGPLLICRLFFSGGHGLLDVVGQGSGLLVYASFSQDYELQADDVGWNYLVAANIDPRGMIDVFRKLQASEALVKALGRAPQAFSGHPALTRRIARLQAKWRALPRKSGFLQLTNPVPVLRD